MPASSFGRTALATSAAIGLLSLISCFGGDAANQAGDDQTPRTTAANPSIAAPTRSHAMPSAAWAAPAPKTEVESFLKRAEAPPPSYPGLPGAVTKAPEWATENAPFDVVAYFTAPADNAAPLYLDALFEFDPDAMKFCLAPDEVARREPGATARAKRAGELIEAYEKEPKTADPRKIDSLVAEYERGFQLLAAAQQRNACMFEPGTGHLTQLPHLSAARTAGRLIVFRIRGDLERGDLGRAIDDLEIELRLSRDIRSRGGLVGGLVSISIDGHLFLDSIPQILAAPDLGKSHCDRLLHALGQHEAKSDLVRGIFQGEYMLLRSQLRPEVHEFLTELAARPDLLPGAQTPAHTRTSLTLPRG